jgi:hypothetical protein
MGNCLCMGLPLICVCHPTPGLDGADDGLSALVDVNVLNGDLLLALTSVAVQGVEEQGVGARECGVAGPNSTPSGSPKGPDRLGEWRAPGLLLCWTYINRPNGHACGFAIALLVTPSDPPLEGRTP